MDTDEAVDLADESAGPERALDEARRRDLLLEALATLTPREREIVSLRYGAELDASEIAKLVGLEPANVRKILERARERLRGHIGSAIGYEGAVR